MIITASLARVISKLRQYISLPHSDSELADLLALMQLLAASHRGIPLQSRTGGNKFNLHSIETVWSVGSGATLHKPASPNLIGDYMALTLIAPANLYTAVRWRFLLHSAVLVGMDVENLPTFSMGLTGAFNGNEVFKPYTRYSDEPVETVVLDPSELVTGLSGFPIVKPVTEESWHPMLPWPYIGRNTAQECLYVYNTSNADFVIPTGASVICKATAIECCDTTSAQGLDDFVLKTNILGTTVDPMRLTAFLNELERS